MTNIDEWFEIDEAGAMANKMLQGAVVTSIRISEQTLGGDYDIAIHDRSASSDLLMSMRLTYAAHSLRELVEIEKDRSGGAPVLAGTRFRISRILAELADGMTVSKLAREFSLDKTKIVAVLRSMSIIFDRPF